MKKEKQAPISESHLIDKDADPIINKILSLRDGWILRDDNPDYRIDHSVELTVNRNPQGKRFYIQRKAVARVTIKNGNPCKYIDTDHLIYYYDKVELPVFLVLVDIETEKVYYVFLQEWIENHLKDTDWRTKQNTHRVHLPIQNDLSDTKTFRTDVLQAMDYMKDKYPGSIAAAVDKEAKRLTKLDPNFDIKVDYVDGHNAVEITLKPGCKSPSLNLTLSGGENIKALQQVVDFGKALDLKSIESTITGSPLFEQDKIVALNISPNQIHKGELSITSNQSHFNLSGIFTKGQKGIQFVSDLDKCPLSVRLLMSVFDSSNNCDFNVSFNLESWSGNDIKTLPYYEKLKSLFHTESLDDVKVEVCIEGSILTTFGGEIPLKKIVTETISPMIEYIEKAKIITQHFNCSAFFPPVEDLSKETFSQINDAFDFMKNGQIEYSFRDNLFLLDLNSLSNNDIIQHCENSKGVISTNTITFVDYIFEVFNSDIDVGSVVAEITNSRIEKVTQSLEEQKEASNNTRIKIIGEKDSILKISKPSKENL